MSPVIGQPVPRIDGHAKVTGRATYAAEFNQPGQLYGVIVGATVGLGRVTAIDDAAVRALPGVRLVLTPGNAPRLAYHPHKGVIDVPDGERLHVLQDDTVRFYGQPVAMVVADTLDQAERGALALRVRYAAERPLTHMTSPDAARAIPPRMARPGTRFQADRARGDADAAVAAAAVKVDVRFELARTHHTAMEPHATVASWTGDRLTLWSKSQFVVNEQNEIAAIFGLPLGNVQVNCPFVGGAFGNALRTWSHVTLAAMAARVAGRPVKVVLTRRQVFFATGFRPHTLQHVALGATQDGTLTGIVHEAETETSRYEQYFEGVTDQTAMLYACPKVRLRHRVVPLDIATPTFMRAPGEATGTHALECAMDELAETLAIDPIELRRRNEPDRDENVGKPFSSRSLLRAFDAGAERFGCARRDKRPGSMRDGRLLIGYGCAASVRAAAQAPANARARIVPDGSVEIEAAASDMGLGTYTAMTQIAADTLGLPMSQVRFTLGRSDLPVTPPHGGSWTLASVGTAIRGACLAAQAALAKQAAADPGSPVAATDRLSWDAGGLRQADGATFTYAELLRGHGPVQADFAASRPAEMTARYSMYGFGAFFAEVAIDPDLMTVRVRRMLGVYGAGRILNPRLATSQCIGGMIGGISMTLMEGTLLDPRDGRPVNAHMADYLVPVNLDIGALDVHFLEEGDPYVNPLGVKGLGELVIVGVAPAVANAVSHATGRRVRDLPIRLDHLLEPA